jgi:PAS domain S-box-containing protein
MPKKKNRNSQLLRILRETGEYHAPTEASGPATKTLGGESGVNHGDGAVEDGRAAVADGGGEPPIPGALFERVFHHSLDLLLLISAESGNILRASKAAYRLLGYKPEDLVGQHCAILHPPDTVPSRSTLDRRLQVYDTVLSDEPILKADGDEISMDMTAMVMPEDSRSLIFATLRDNTERKQAAAEKQRIITELRQTQKKVTQMRGLLPICSFCNRIQNESGAWERLEIFVENHSAARLSHGLCPACLRKHYPDYHADVGERPASPQNKDPSDDQG